MTEAQIDPDQDSVRHWPAPETAASLYVGDVMHQRMKPVGHRFTYPVFSLLIDLARLSDAGSQSRLFSVNAANLVSFFEKDHINGSDQSLKAYAERLLLQAGVTAEPKRILLMCYPRILGFVFNPLSVYYAYGYHDQLLAMIYEVRNTFGDRHSYVCPVSADEMSDAGLRQSMDKIFHVSPFIPLKMRYHFRMLPPGETVRWRILETDAEGPLLSATFAGDRRDLTSAVLTRLLARIPFLTFKIVAAIHWEALKLWIKGMKYIPRPNPPAPVSVKTESIIFDLQKKN
jgi:DUF1365 family protein